MQVQQMAQQLQALQGTIAQRHSTISTTQQGHKAGQPGAPAGGANPATMISQLALISEQAQAMMQHMATWQAS
jgi:hypothetical protein